MPPLPMHPGRIIPLTGPYEPRILVTQHPTDHPRFYGELIQWTADHVPEFARLFYVADLPARLIPWPQIALHTAWLQDPVQAWSRETYEHELRIAAACDRMGIPILNRVERLTNAGKHRAAEIMRSVGLNVPASALITDADEFRRTLMGLRPPLLVREDWAHWGPMARAETADEARSIDLSRYTRPVAKEIIDARDPRDGLYRKYRFLVAGRVGVPQHLQVSESWITRGEGRVISRRTRDEELAYINSSDPLAPQFHEAARAMGLDFVAFDYGRAADGRPIVWEANPFPHFRLAKAETRYRNSAIHRSYAAMLRMYLDAGAIPASKASAEAIDSFLLGA